jgi:hypothetical protein
VVLNAQPTNDKAVITQQTLVPNMRVQLSAGFTKSGKHRNVPTVKLRQLLPSKHTGNLAWMQAETKTRIKTDKQTDSFKGVLRWFGNVLTQGQMHD